MLVVGACTSGSLQSSPVVPPSVSSPNESALPDFDQLLQLGKDQGMLCAPKGDYEGTPTSSCAGRDTDTLMILTIGPGFDGVKDLHKAIATCPPYAGVHGEIWAGDGYLVSLYLDGDSPTESELAIESAVGVEPTCEF